MQLDSGRGALEIGNCSHRTEQAEPSTGLLTCQRNSHNLNSNIGKGEKARTNACSYHPDRIPCECDALKTDGLCCLKKTSLKRGA